MRMVVATAVLLGGAVLFYAPWSRPVSAQGQSPQASITQGERIRIWFDATKMSYDCTVIDVRGDFLGCRGSENTFRPGPERWYNLRQIALIERSVKQD